MDDEELIELVEMELAELLEGYDFDPDTPIIKGSALAAEESESSDPNAPEYASIVELMDAVDDWIPTPMRDVDKPFMMAIEDVFSIKGRGTVVTGSVARGTLLKGTEVDIVGLRDEIVQTVVTGIEMFNKELDQAQAGRQRRHFAARHWPRGSSARYGYRQGRFDNAAQEIQVRSLCAAP